MKNYYSQNGEDFLLWELFRNKNLPGVFVEVGGLEGIRFSNTYSFEREGWTGVCVEPHPDYFPLLKANRPRSYCVEMAAGNQVGQIQFYADPCGEFSTIFKNNTYKQTIAGKMANWKKIKVNVTTLDAILQNAKILPPLDIVSIDVEGAEINVLKGFDMAFYKPRVLVIEANDDVSDKKLDGYMKSRGYCKAGRLGRINNFYCRSRLDAAKLALVSIDCVVNIPPSVMNSRPGINKDWIRRQICQPSLL